MPILFRHATYWMSMLASFFCLSLFPTNADEELLFDGKTLAGWTLNHGEPITYGWEVVESMIHLDQTKSKYNGQRVGNILTVREYHDFDLSFEWKISKGGNSGLKYRVRNYEGNTYGLEYQICDELNYPKELTPRTSAGSLYDLYEPNHNKWLKPIGEFNISRIRVQEQTIQHWLNGRLILTAIVGSPEWRDRVARSKFSELPDFGMNPNGKIMLTDHSCEVWYRNFKLVELNHETKFSPSEQP